MKPCDKKQALIAIGGLSTPSKMPGHGYGIAATMCITGSKLAKIHGSVCYGCYALKGQYNYPVVKQAHARRLASIDSIDWVDNMVIAITSTKDTYFRWHDSGDLQSVEHLVKICKVAAQTSSINHWLPTREYKIVTDYLARGGIIPANLTIRLSAHMIDGPAPVGYGLPTSTVHDTSAPVGKVCPAPSHGNQCGSCRNCWDSSVPNVSYHKH